MQPWVAPAARTAELLCCSAARAGQRNAQRARQTIAARDPSSALPPQCESVCSLSVKGSKDAPAFHIFYATGWRDAVLRVRTLDADGAPQTPARRCGERLGQLAVQGFYAAGV